MDAWAGQQALGMRASWLAVVAQGAYGLGNRRNHLMCSVCALPGRSLTRLLVPEVPGVRAQRSACGTRGRRMHMPKRVPGPDSRGPCGACSERACQKAGAPSRQVGKARRWTGLTPSAASVRSSTVCVRAHADP